MRLPAGHKLGKGTDRTPGVLNSEGKEITDLTSAPMIDAIAMDNPDKGLIGQAKATVDGDSVIYSFHA